jgi:transcriptional regulator with XRE-family HTH domain
MSSADNRLHTIGERLRGARKGADSERKQFERSTARAKKHSRLAQAAVAKHLGISQSYLSKVESGLQEPGFLLVESMCAYYGIKLTQLFTLSKSEQEQAHNFHHNI